MNKNTGIIVGIIALIVVVGGVYASMNMKNDVMMQKDGAMVKEEAGMVEEGDDVVKTDAMMKAGSYEAYAPEKIARAETGDVVLFFHASWCPSCRGLNSDIEANVSAISEGVSILKTDYDTQIELKKKYGVTYQHTLVQVDKDGNLIKKWSGSPSLTSLVAQVQ